MNKFKQILSHSVELFIGLMASMWIGLLITDIVLILIVRLAFSVSPFIDRMCRIVGYIAVLSIAIAIYSGKIAFKKKNFCIGQTLASAGLMCIYQMAVAPIFKCVMYVSGAAWYLGQIFFGQANTPFSQIEYAPTLYYILGMLICDVFYIFAISIGGYVGYRRKVRFVKDLTENKS